MMNLDLLFTSANLFVLPFWALIILLPNWNVTRRIIGSPIPFMLLAALYLYLLSGAIDPETAKALSNPKLADLASAFGNLQVTAAGWVHFLVMDLFVGRWIYFDHTPISLGPVYAGASRCHESISRMHEETRFCGKTGFLG
ncbi:MAG: DUF4281 domain-containing protein [Hormoscilla sp. GUM202]|nr:DUF4281 domain-containing protein [Hormoscilla sp. GUM202]